MLDLSEREVTLICESLVICSKLKETNVGMMVELLNLRSKLLTKPEEDTKEEQKTEATNEA